ncbi:hypothetical protein [Paenibacillus segetis]|uniref:Uncharacterized protein n=1 Tax=Paenibacillus segetis TaxID=1325360 RepID=A0ABQ1YD59_9BACL|nr:hypothetical protein [Paenibacillus segetis]GGH20503.1 hypothetical protein GCM10008013_17910 [Paenibacillus segetis]
MFEYHQTYQTSFNEGELTLSLHIPLENYQMGTPMIARQEVNHELGVYGLSHFPPQDIRV